MSFTANYVVSAGTGSVLQLGPILEKLFSGSGIFGYYIQNFAGDPTQGNWGNGTTETQIIDNGMVRNDGFFATDLANLTIRLGDDLWSGIYVSANHRPGNYTTCAIQIVPVAYVDATPHQTTGADVVAAAYQLLAFTGDTYSPNGCHTIAATIAAMAGAPLPNDSASIVPSENVDGGF